MAKKDDDWDLNDLNEDEDDYDDDEENEDGDDDDSDEDDEDSARSKRLIFASLKILVSLALLAAAGVMVFAPEKIPDSVTDKLEQVKPLVGQAKQRVENIVAKIAKDEPSPAKPADLPKIQHPAPEPKRAEPVNFAQKRALPAPQSVENAPQQAQQPQQPRQTQQNRFNLRGAGQIPDLLTAISQRPQLREALLKADVYTFESLPRLRPFIRSFILQWANVATTGEAAALAGMPFSDFENRVLIDLLPFTTLRRAGLTPSYDGTLIKESPEEAAASLFMYLKPIVDSKTTDNEKLAVVEPVSTFLLYRCGNRKECLESWDLLIDMLELSDFKERLRQ